MDSIIIRNKKLNFPAFFPDATYGKVRGIDSDDLKSVNLDGVVVNAYHLAKSDLFEKIQKVGINNFTNLKDKIIISDSGGFQVMSLIHKNPKLGKITDEGALFKFGGKNILLTPEKCIEIQIKLGSDIVMCLDECTKPDISLKEQEKSVIRTIEWAKRCKKEFLKLTNRKKESERPKLFAIIQGGESKKLRKKCADEFIKIGFDGFAFGGFPVKNKKLLEGILSYTESLIPDDKPKYAMGVGKPEDIIKCVKMGYDMFDCVIPTREARHRKLYSFIRKVKGKNFKNSIREEIINEKFLKKQKKISNFCDCFACKNFSRKELKDAKVDDKELFIKLATVHNLRTYTKLMEEMRKK